MIAFYHDKDIDMLKLCCTVPNLANVCSHNSTDAKFYPFTEGDRDLLKKVRDVVGGPSIGFTCKAVVDETLVLSESLQTYANLMLGLMPANYIPTRCVNSCRQVFVRVGISFQNRVDSNLDKTRLAALKIWSCPVSNEHDQNVKLKASLQQAERRKLTASVLMGFVLIATLCLKPSVNLTSSLIAKSCVPLSVKRIFNVVARGESSMHWGDTIYKRKASRFLKCGSANGGDCTKQPILLNNIFENTFLTDVHLLLSNF